MKWVMKTNMVSIISDGDQFSRSTYAWFLESIWGRGLAQQREIRKRRIHTWWEFLAFVILPSIFVHQHMREWARIGARVSAEIDSRVTKAEFSTWHYNTSSLTLLIQKLLWNISGTAESQKGLLERAYGFWSACWHREQYVNIAFTTGIAHNAPIPNGSENIAVFMILIWRIQLFYGLWRISLHGESKN